MHTAQSPRGRGAESIKASADAAPDVVLLDLAAGSELEVVDWLRTRDELPRVPIVVYRRKLDPEAVRDGVIEVLRHALPAGR